jgi:hypothetical protein
MDIFVARNKFKILMPPYRRNVNNLRLMFPKANNPPTDGFNVEYQNVNQHLLLNILVITQTPFFALFYA